MTNRSAVAPAGSKRRRLGDSALTKWFYGFNSWLVLGPVIPKTLKMGVVPGCMVLAMKWRSRNITGLPGVSILDWVG